MVVCAVVQHRLLRQTKQEVRKIQSRVRKQTVPAKQAGSLSVEYELAARIADGAVNVIDRAGDIRAEREIMVAPVHSEGIRRSICPVIGIRWCPVVQSVEIDEGYRREPPVGGILRDARDAEQSGDIRQVGIEIRALVVVPVYPELHLILHPADRLAETDLHVERVLEAAPADGREIPDLHVVLPLKLELDAQC